MRSRETRKNQGNLEAAVKGNSHGGLAGMMLMGLYDMVWSGGSRIGKGYQYLEGQAEAEWSSRLQKAQW